MKYYADSNDVIVEIDGFSLIDTLDCGQSFRWEIVNANEVRGIAFGLCKTILQQGDLIIFKDTSITEFEDIWLDYFDFTTDYELIKKELAADDVLNSAIKYAGGIRILKQDPWETICSFIISQNNNIPRIKGIIQRLCENFGEQINNDFYTFPSAQKIAKLSEQDLSPLRAGFRARYILDAAQKISTNQVDIDRIQISDLETARKELLKITGVGVKVAECALLFGFHRTEAFPVDVWIKRALDYYYKDGFPEFAKKYGGIAQQYIFHYIRTCDDAIPAEYKK